jgi:two-component system, OmpR family, phosphate regulon response regulator OmpR
MSDKGRILVVDDDSDVRDTIREYFELSGYEVYVAGDAGAMRKVMGERRVDLVLMDLNLPGEDGLTLTRQLRASSSVCIIMLTAAGQTIDRIVGLEMGADDYLPKPFEPNELVLRIRAILRRAASSAAAPAGPVQLGEATFDPERAELRSPDRTIRLTGGEAALLAALARRPHEVLSREDLAAALGMDETGERAIDVQVTRLRRKIEADPREPRFLLTMRGRGYVLRPGA